MPRQWKVLLRLRFTNNINKHTTCDDGDVVHLTSNASAILEGGEFEGKYWWLNAQKKADAFILECLKRRERVAGNHLLVTMGSDFAFQNADVWFSSIDKLIHHIRQRGSVVNVFYSTPQQYVDAKAEENLAYSVRNGDFFPYADSAHAYRTGYFSSRPASKRFVRLASSILQSTSRLAVLASITTPNPSLQRLREAVAVLQHHDAITGTARQHVAADYAKQLSEGIRSVELTTLQLGFQRLLQANCTFHFCSRSNESVCEFAREHPRGFRISVFNPLARSSNGRYLTIPVDRPGYQVTDLYTGKLVSSSVVPVPFGDPTKSGSSRHRLYFQVSVPALAIHSYAVQALDSVAQADQTKYTGFVLSNGLVALGFDPRCGKIESLTTYVGESEQVSISLSHGMQYYEATTHLDQPSGAYIFRPRSNHPKPIPEASNSAGNGCPTEFSFVKGVGVQELRQSWGSWAHLVYRLYDGAKHVEAEWVIDHIPLAADERGRDVISRFSSNISSSGIFYTDANGRAFQKRERNAQVNWKPVGEDAEPVASNYYPVTTALYIHDEDAHFAIVTDRSQGGTSLADGQLELMLHRRHLLDDYRGVNEALNEPPDQRFRKSGNSWRNSWLNLSLLCINFATQLAAKKPRWLLMELKQIYQTM
ncbi:TPA: hypothetical protein N0F65_001453 [Lagenidium giganteum]|uniref:Alpha-mannosidase n=1 Tax=Lagenidium giganteum TaxID=4803 RepID=A0AAV2YZX9_9STRA|nr:TPA: hypothetical protein N0F65_001453 [Lagenidium giganteum]